MTPPSCKLPAIARSGAALLLLATLAAGGALSGGAVTLTTYRDVPWNAPFYRRVGFEVVDDPTPGVAEVRAAERAEGLDAFGPRVAMRLAL